MDSLSADEKFNQEKVEKKIIKDCKNIHKKGKDERFVSRDTYLSIVHLF
jgi:hypothetical protein